MIGAKSYWWALASLPLMIVGALGPWARTLGGTVDGNQDEFVLLLAIAGALMLVLLAASNSRWLALLPLLVGLTAAALTGNDIHDIADFAPQVSGRLASVEWGIYLALFGSTGLALASVLLFVETTRSPAAAAPSRRRRLARRLALTESARRKAFVSEAASFAPYVGIETNEVADERTLFFLPTRQKAGRDRFVKAEWKESRHLQRALDALEQVGIEVARTMFVDVGAHIGTTTITAVRRFGFESALAFEPEPGNFRLLRTNLVVNSLETRIQTLNVAVSNRIGEAQLKLRPSMGSKHRLFRGDEVAGNSVSVPLTSLDALVEEGSLDAAKVSLLWLDIEGHELEALQGAQALRERSVPIVMEFIPRELRRDGRLEALRSLLGEHYTHILDLRLRSDVPDIRPLSALPRLAEHYKRGFTDLLVFHLPNESAVSTHTRRPGSTRRAWAEPRWHQAGVELYPSERALFERELGRVIREHSIVGHVPDRPLLAATDDVVTLGSCFAREVTHFLKEAGLLSRRIFMPEGLNNTYAMLDFISWCVTGEATGAGFRYERLESGEIREWLPERKREAYATSIAEAGAFVLTIGLAEVWQDRETGGVFWHGIPEEIFDPDRHVFRLTTVDENAENIRRIVELVRQVNADAPIVLTLSPVPLKGTFRDIACMSADCVSKSVLRVALDQVTTKAPPGVYYWPSFEIVRWAGAHFTWPAYGLDDDKTRHVSRRLVAEIVDAFVETFYTPEAVAAIRAAR